VKNGNPNAPDDADDSVADADSLMITDATHECEKETRERSSAQKKG